MMTIPSSALGEEQQGDPTMTMMEIDRATPVSGVAISTTAMAKAKPGAGGQSGAFFQDWELPKAGINRCIRSALPARPTHRDFKTALSRAGTIFVAYLTTMCQEVAKERSSASSTSAGVQRTLTQSHVQEALRRLGFADWLDTINERIELDTTTKRLRRLRTVGKSQKGHQLSAQQQEDLDVINDDPGIQVDGAADDKDEMDDEDDEETDSEDMLRESELPSFNNHLASTHLTSINDQVGANSQDSLEFVSDGEEDMSGVSSSFSSAEIDHSVNEDDGEDDGDASEDGEVSDDLDFGQQDSDEQTIMSEEGEPAEDDQDDRQSKHKDD